MKMKAAQISKPGGDWELVERAIPEPGAGQVRVKVEACGICHSGHDFICEQCRRGDFAMCVNRKVTGIDFDGGYAEYMIAPAAALALIPDELPAEEAGPFMCAGVTVYNALRHSGARGGDVVAVQ